MKNITVEKAKLDSGYPVLELFSATDLADTNGEARRLVLGGGASINGRKVDDPKTVIDASWLDERGN